MKVIVLLLVSTALFFACAESRIFGSTELNNDEEHSYNEGMDDIEFPDWGFGLGQYSITPRSIPPPPPRSFTYVE